jgi:DNA-binding HxlR family transcriptional regulator
MSSEPHRTERARLFTDTDAVLLAMQGIVGRKWQPVIVHHLLDGGSVGFSDLKSRIDGISSKMLSESLDDLEAAGLIERELLSDKPVRVNYSLTERGETLRPLVTEMVRWGSDHLEVDGAGDGPAAPAGVTRR